MDLRVAGRLTGDRKQRRKLSKQEVRRLLNGLAFISPWIVGFLGLTLYPIIRSLYYSFTDFSLFTSPNWIGLLNYVEMFTLDDKFLLSLYNTLYFTVLIIPASIVSALILAVALNSRIRGVSFYRAVFFMPTVVPAVATAVVWGFLLNPRWGLVNSFLALLGISGPPWLASPSWSKPSLVFVTLWGVGSDMMIYLAGLQDIPKDYYEAADLDGASFFQKTRYITVPLLTPVVFFHLVSGTIWAFQYFTIAYVMTDGGPANSTLFYALYLYRNAFDYVKMGYASAMAWVLFAVVMLATMVIFRTSKGWVHYEQ